MVSTGIEMPTSARIIVAQQQRNVVGNQLPLRQGDQRGQRVRSNQCAQDLGPALSKMGWVIYGMHLFKELESAPYLLTLVLAPTIHPCSRLIPARKR